MELKGCTILITGGTSGIGLEFVKQLIPRGVAKIIITGRDMKVDKMVKIAIHGVLKDKKEIKPGMSKVLKFMSRAAPHPISFSISWTESPQKKNHRYNNYLSK